MSLVDKEEIEFHVRGVAETHIPSKDMSRPAELCLKCGGKRLSARRVCGTILLLQHFGKQLHSDNGLSGPRPSSNEHSTALVLLLLPCDFGNYAVVRLTLHVEQMPITITFQNGCECVDHLRTRLEATGAHATYQRHAATATDLFSQ